MKKSKIEERKRSGDRDVEVYEDSEIVNPLFLYSEFLAKFEVSL
jgi:hypothetical protein